MITLWSITQIALDHRRRSGNPPETRIRSVAKMKNGATGWPKTVALAGRTLLSEVVSASTVEGVAGLRMATPV